MLLASFAVLLTWVRSSWQVQFYVQVRHNTHEMARSAPRRIALLGEQHCQSTEQRMGEMNEMRFMYEESPHYELGYLMNEVVTRYRRAVHSVRRPMEFQADNVYMTLRHTETIQNLYFDIYHIVNMMHEIHLKYAYLPEFQNLAEEIDVARVVEEQEAIRLKERLEGRERKKTARFYKKLEELAKIQEERHKKTQKINKLWPLDYGWEIENWW